MRINNLILLGLIFALVAPMLGDEKTDIKNRMAERLPTINQLKDQGQIGENNQGYLEFREPSQVKAQLIADENSDRRKVYQMISAEIGVPVDEVGKRRAVMIAEKESPGRWLQKPDGAWYRK